MYDIIIIGAGVGGMAAAATSTEKNLKTLVIGKNFLKLADSFFGIFDINQLTEKFNQLVKNKKVDFLETEVLNLEKNIVSFSVEIKTGALYYSKAVLIATSSGSLDFDRITQKDQIGKIKVDSCQKTSIPGIWAVGQATWGKNFSSDVEVGEAIKAVESVLDTKL
jgi:thioredoxin reductase